VITLLLLVHATYIWCCSSRTFRSWWATHLAQRQWRRCNNRLYHKNWDLSWRKKETVIFSHRGTYFSVKSQKRAKRSIKFFKANKLELRPNSKIKLFRPNNLKRGQISQNWPKKTNLATLPVEGNHIGLLEAEMALVAECRSRLRQDFGCFFQTQAWSQKFVNNRTWCQTKFLT